MNYEIRNGFLQRKKFDQHELGVAMGLALMIIIITISLI